MCDTSYLLSGDALSELKKLPDGFAQCCVTSPPYWGLRDYGMPGQLGLETTPGEYVASLLPVFAEVWRVLRDDGTLWLNLGDSYIGCHGNIDGLKNKDLAGIPWRVAFALQDAGWYLRSDCIWNKPNPMPESVRDRPTRAHEYLFLLSKNPRYYYDADSVREPTVGMRGGRVLSLEAVSFGRSVREPDRPNCRSRQHRPERSKNVVLSMTRNRRSVWTVATQKGAGAHFATFPPELIRPCIKAGAPQGGLVLDPFFGTGTVGIVCLKEGRRFCGIEINPEYVVMARQRLSGTKPRSELSLF